MIDNPLAATLAFFALGANLLGAILLLLLNSGSRSLRWYMPFQFAILIWLLGQGANQLHPNVIWEATDIFGAAMLPMLFLLFAIMEAPGRPTWHGILFVLLCAPLVPFVMRSMYASAGPLLGDFAILWFLAGWLGGPLILWIRGMRKARQEPPRPGIQRQIAVMALLLLVPVSIVGTLLVHAGGFVLYVIPIMTVIVQFLIFYALTRMQFYNIEVRVRRSGDIAAATVEMERLAVLGEVAATIAHEVRNPLTGVRSLAQRMATDDILPEKRKQYGAVILEETGRVDRLVGNLLELARHGASREPSSLTTTSLNALFDDLTMLVASRADRAQVRIITRANDLEAPASREALAQALMNLLLNAIAHSPANSTIELEARQTQDRTEILVRDQGPGIPAQDRQRIFDAFYTTSAHGTGLGLAVVRHLATEHNWHVNSQDAAGGGTVFTIGIPCAS